MPARAGGGAAAAGGVLPPRRGEARRPPAPAAPSPLRRPPPRGPAAQRHLADSSRISNPSRDAAAPGARSGAQHPASDAHAHSLSRSAARAHYRRRRTGGKTPPRKAPPTPLSNATTR
ncbi:unnamed protein product, partial [Iphiclides podalirius]